MRVLSLVSNSEARFYKQETRLLRDRGVDLETFPVPGYSQNADRSNGSRSIGAYLQSYPRAISEAYREYDVVHANYGLTAPPAVLQSACPVVLTLWGSDLLGEFGWLSRLCAARADAVIVMSDEMSAELDVDSHVVPHGVDFDRFRPIDRSEARATVSWDEDGYQVLFPYDRSREIKNFPRAQRVVELAEERLGEPIELRTVTGAEHEDMPPYLNAADVMLLTSRREGSPNSVKEALACNVPVVSTDVGDVSDRLSNVSRSAVADTDGELADRLVEILRSDRRSDGREEIRELSLERQVDRIQDVYRAVLAK